MQDELDFGNECRVHILCEDATRGNVQLTYERPRQIDDDALTTEALYIYEDAKRGGVGNVQELIAVFIARNDVQESQIQAKSISIP